jgi:hypothetical protein
MICATFDLGENYNVEYQALSDAHILSDKHISVYIIHDCCVPSITKGKSGTVLPELEVG